MHVAVLFAIVQIIELMIALIICSVPTNDLIDAGATGRGLMAAAMGACIACMGPRPTFVAGLRGGQVSLKGANCPLLAGSGRWPNG